MKATSGNSSAILLIVIAFLFAACTGNSEEREVKEMKIRIIVGETELTATLIDSEPSREFAEMLPLKLSLDDYAGTEKISYLPRKLSTGSAPAGYDPSVGDITYYAPWGNLAIFYKDFGYANGLVLLGRMDEGGIEILSQLRGKTDIRIEKLK